MVTKITYRRAKKVGKTQVASRKWNSVETTPWVYGVNPEIHSDAPLDLRGTSTSDQARPLNPITIVPTRAPLFTGSLPPPISLALYKKSKGLRTRAVLKNSKSSKKIELISYYSHTCVNREESSLTRGALVASNQVDSSLELRMPRGIQSADMHESYMIFAVIRISERLSSYVMRICSTESSADQLAERSSTHSYGRHSRSSRPNRMLGGCLTSCASYMPGLGLQSSARETSVGCRN